MLTRQQLEILNRKTFRYPLEIAEKDYVLVLVLQLLSKSPLGQKLVFKGGTCLHHCYLEQQRFSEDLDFSTGQQSISFEEVKNVFDSAVFDNQKALPIQGNNKNRTITFQRTT
jgi:predicted nucleotidyltransferase component of viral defense system